MLAEDDWEQVDLFEQKRFPLPHFADVPHGHLRLADLRGHLPNEVLDSYYKFTFLREPVDRFISTCFFVYHKVPLFQRNPKAYMKLLLKTEKELPRFLFKRQCHFVMDQEKHENIMDFQGDFAHLQRDFDQLSTRFGWPKQQLNKVNASERLSNEPHCDSELKELIEDYYQEDVALYKHLGQS